MFHGQQYELMAKSIHKHIPDDTTITKDRLVEILCNVFELDNPTRFNRVEFTMNCSGIKPNKLAKAIGDKRTKPLPTPVPSAGSIRNKKSSFVGWMTRKI